MVVLSSDIRQKGAVGVLGAAKPITYFEILVPLKSLPNPLMEVALGFHSVCFKTKQFQSKTVVWVITSQTPPLVALLLASASLQQSKLITAR